MEQLPPLFSTDVEGFQRGANRLQNQHICSDSTAW
jgi:hypothetical protein